MGASAAGSQTWPASRPSYGWAASQGLRSCRLSFAAWWAIRRKSIATFSQKHRWISLIAASAIASASCAFSRKYRSSMAKTPSQPNFPLGIIFPSEKGRVHYNDCTVLAETSVASNSRKYSASGMP